MQEATVVEKVENEKNEKTEYTATLTLTNSSKVGFTRRDLALCFFPSAVVEKADRRYEVISIDGAIIPFDNPRTVKRIWDIVQQRYIYDGTVKKVDRYAFDWAKIVKRLINQFNLKSLYVYPERQPIVNVIKATTNTVDLSEHTQIVTNLWGLIRKNAPHLTFEKEHCVYNVEGPCPL